MTDTETLDATVLDSQDLRALRHADSVCFYQRDGRSYIRAVLDGRGTATGYDQDHHVWVDYSLSDYGREYSGMTSPASVSAFYMEHSAKFSPTLQTIIGRLSIGDTIRLHWTLDNNNDLTRDAGLHVDMLHMVITKKNGKHEQYLVSVSVSRDNSARMIRRTS